MSGHDFVTDKPRNRPKGENKHLELWFLCITCRLNVLYKCMKSRWNISNGFQVIELTRLCDGQTDGRENNMSPDPSREGGGERGGNIIHNCSKAHCQSQHQCHIWQMNLMFEANCTCKPGLGSPSIKAALSPQSNSYIFKANLQWFFRICNRS